MIYSHQQDAYNALKLNRMAHQQALEDGLPVRLHTLMIGASGSGKTKLARMVYDNAFYVTANAWVVVGAREKPTVDSVVSYLVTEPNPVFIIDEIDKIYSEDAWTRNVRSELFLLLDGAFPRMSRYEDEDELEDFKKAEANLKNAFIIGVGAFQDNMEAEPVGFIRADFITSRGDLRKTLPTELVNRFGEVITLQKPQPDVLLRELLEEYPSIGGEIKEAAKSVDVDISMGVRYAETVFSQVAKNRAMQRIELQDMQLEFEESLCVIHNELEIMAPELFMEANQ